MYDCTIDISRQYCFNDVFKYIGSYLSLLFIHFFIVRKFDFKILFTFQNMPGMYLISYFGNTMFYLM